MASAVAAAWVRRRLLAWYGRQARTLPWRLPPGARGGRPEAYRVWVSEIMLQQTRVAAVIPYYGRFLRRFPSVAALAAAEESEVLAHWSGLGYYRRARQMHAAARVVMSGHGGEFPLEEAAARALPGIGAYTAAAILSIAGGLPLAAVDGNGLRIAQRLRGRALSLGEARRLWEEWLAPRRAGDFNQAVMDLGATVCLPRAPLCPCCPLRRACRAQAPIVQPRRRPSRAVVLHYGWCVRGARIWLRQRAPWEAQMPGLWELPELASAPQQPPRARFTHAITTRRITAYVYELGAGGAGAGGRWFGLPQARSLALTGLARKMLRKLAPPPA